MQQLTPDDPSRARTALTWPGVPTMMCGHLSLSFSCSRCCLMGRPPKKLPTRPFFTNVVNLAH